MSTLAASVVDWSKLGQVVLYSLGAGVGVCLSFSLAIYGATRFDDMRRSGGGAGAVIYAVLVALGLAVTLAAVTVGIIVMTSKG